MKLFMITFFILGCLRVYAMDPEYSSSIAYVVKHACVKDSPDNEKIYIASVPGDLPVYAIIVTYNKDTSLRTIIDQSRYKNLDVAVMILRSNRKSNIFLDSNVTSKDEPSVKLLPGDMIWLSKPSTPR